MYYVRHPAKKKVVMTVTNNGDRNLITLGKERAFAECLLVWRSAKKALVDSTIASVSRVVNWYSAKEAPLPRVRHSAKGPPVGPLLIFFAE
jgi:hypothetical protein